MSSEVNKPRIKETEIINDSALIVFNPFFVVFPRFFKVFDIIASWLLLASRCAVAWFVILAHFGYFAFVVSLIVIAILYAYNIGNYRPSQVLASEQYKQRMREHLAAGGSVWTMPPSFPPRDYNF